MLISPSNLEIFPLQTKSNAKDIWHIRTSYNWVKWQVHRGAYENFLQQEAAFGKLQNYNLLQLRAATNLWTCSGTELITWSESFRRQGPPTAHFRAISLKVSVFHLKEFSTKTRYNCQLTSITTPAYNPVNGSPTIQAIYFFEWSYLLDYSKQVTEPPATDMQESAVPCHVWPDLAQTVVLLQFWGWKKAFPRQTVIL